MGERKLLVLVKVMFAGFLVFALGACKNASLIEDGNSIETARMAGAEGTQTNKLYLRPTKNEFCQIGPKNTPYFQNLFNEQKESSQNSNLKGAISELENRMKSKVAIEMCNVEVEDWILKSLALGKPAPYEVAGLKQFPWRLAKACAAIGTVVLSPHHNLAASAAILAILLDYGEAKSKDC